jgi:phosphoribosylformylglycinamidine synthase II
MSERIEKLASLVGLSSREYEHLVSTLKREPSETELQMIGVMWSEHCSYKSTKRFLKKIITKGSHVLQGPGENAGLVSLDEKRAVAFKVESHNHPSFVEPFQGAATGVGGILRDIFTMGAQPVALGNYLRFGQKTAARQDFLLEGVVSGIAHYGNCVGVPTVAGQVKMSPCYNSNILVNVFAAGVVEKDKIYRSATASPGQSVMVWGAKTGRDGIHGASLLASADFSEENKADGQKVRVQVGDPFKEKCLMDACLEVMRLFPEDLMAIQDMGAAGLTCSTMEISYKSKVGMKVELDLVPTREPGMEAYELLLSESQERMLAIVKKGSEKKFEEVMHRWGCEAIVIGETTEGGNLEMTFKGEKLVDLPVADVQDPPDAELPEPEWELPTRRTQFQFPEIQDEWGALTYLLKQPSVASKETIFERYDSTVGAATVLGPGHEAAVVWTPSSDQPHRGIAFKGVSHEAWNLIDPRAGAEMALAQGVRSLACVGAKALAFTDGVNLGNPHEPETLGALDRAVQGMNAAIEIFDTPCVSGNVSLYNQTSEGDRKVNIDPTIFYVMVGAMDDVRRAIPSHFQEVGSEVWMLDSLGRSEDQPLGSLYSRVVGVGFDQLPPYDLRAEKILQDALLRAHKEGLFLSCRDISEGGLAVSLAKACFGANAAIGFDGDFLKAQQRRDALLFGESQGRVIVEIRPQRRAELIRLSMDTKVQAKRLGSVSGDGRFQMKPLLAGDVNELRQSWRACFS